MLIHLNTMSGNGYGKGHELGFNMDNEKEFNKLSLWLDYHNKYLKEVPLVLEVREDDYGDCINYQNTKNAINKIISNKN